MLRHFLYLNTIALDGYIGPLEDGLRVSLENELTGSADGNVSGDLKVVKGSLGKSSGTTRRTTGQDTPETRFDRLISLAEQNSDSMAWVDVLDADSDLRNIGFGAMVAGEAEFYIPRMVGLLASGELNQALTLIDQLEPLAGLLNFDMQGMPGKETRNAVRSAVEGFGADVVAVGEFDDSDWKVAGQLSKDFIRTQVDGPARFVGKVSKQWPAGEWRHLLALPGTTLLPRHERRALERQKPEDPNDDTYLIGPALMLDILAIWR